MPQKLLGCLAAGALSLALLVGVPAYASAGSYARVVAHGSITGTLTSVDGSSVTIQTPGKTTGVINELTAAASRITKGDYPYVYGGGHSQAGVASIGIKGPGYNGRRKGFDCSGSVAAVLAGAGLWPAGSGVPNDAGIIAQLLSERLIAPGVGSGPAEVSLYDDPGVHIFMSIDGRFFGTSDGGGGGDRKGGPGWLDDGAPDAFTRVYRHYHLLSSALRGTSGAGHSITFVSDSLQTELASLHPGERVTVSYEEDAAGFMVATGLAYPGAGAAREQASNSGGAGEIGASLER